MPNIHDKYYAFNQEGDYLHTGYNTNSREECIDAGIELIEPQTDLSEEELEGLNYEQKEELLAGGYDMYIEEQGYPFPEYDDEGDAVYLMD